SVELSQMTAGERRPHHPVAVYVRTANPEAGERNVVHLRERGVRRIWAWIQANQRARIAAPRAPYGTVHGTRHDRVVACVDAPIEGRIQRLVRLRVRIALSVAVGVENQRRPALRSLGIAGLVEQLRVEPADHVP